MIDFTIEGNEGIRKFMEGSDDYLPVSELLYLHEHPLIKPTFLTQIMEKIATLPDDLPLRFPNSYETFGSRLVEATIKLVEALPELNEDTAKRVLLTLRDINNIVGELGKLL